MPKGSVALVAGGTAGIGLASAAALLRAGHRVFIVGRSPERGKSACEKLRRTTPAADIHFFSADVSLPEGAQSAIRACIDAFGRIDVLVSVAGGAPLPRPVHETPLADVSRIIGSITSGILLPVRAALPVMMQQNSGSIICIASDAAKIATPGEAPIGAAMAAVVMFCRALAIEAKRSHVRVNCITPSIVKNTPFYDVLMEDAFASKLFKKAEGLALLGVVEPDDVASLVVFLAGNESSRLTGQTISVNGGISAA